MAKSRALQGPFSAGEEVRPRGEKSDAKTPRQAGESQCGQEQAGERAAGNNGDG